MNALVQLLERGGWVMPVIVALSVMLYSRCFRLFFSLSRMRRQLRAAAGRPQLHQLQIEIRESFRRQRAAIGPMIAAAPLLGLLGTVSGMEKTFASLSADAGQKSMEGLAGGGRHVLLLFLRMARMLLQICPPRLAKSGAFRTFYIPVATFAKHGADDLYDGL